MPLVVLCPLCHTRITFVGSVGITVHDHGDAQGNRYDCQKGHTLIVISTARIAEDEQDQSEIADKWGALMGEICDECGAFIPPEMTSVQNRAHAPSCSLHPDAEKD